MATPEIFLVAKTLISALARVNEVNAGVTTPPLVEVTSIPSMSLVEKQEGNHKQKPR